MGKGEGIGGRGGDRERRWEDWEIGGGVLMWFRRKMLKKADAVKMYSGWRSIQACIRDSREVDRVGQKQNSE